MPIKFTSTEQKIVDEYRRCIAEADAAMKNLCTAIISRAGADGARYTIGQDGLYEQAPDPQN